MGAVALMAAAAGPCLQAQATESVPTPGQPGTPGAESLQAIRQVFEAYRTALSEGDSTTAAALVDQATHDYWHELRTLALEADAATLRERSFIERLLVVSLRHEIDAAKISSMELSGLLETAIASGWVAAASVDRLEMGAVTVEGTVASAPAMTGSTAPNDSVAAPAAVEGLEYRFRYENGAWRFGFADLVRGLEGVIAELTRQLGTGEDDLIFMLVENLTGRPVLPAVWERPPAATPEDAEPPG